MAKAIAIGASLAQPWPLSFFWESILSLFLLLPELWRHFITSQDLLKRDRRA